MQSLLRMISMRQQGNRLVKDINAGDSCSFGISKRSTISWGSASLGRLGNNRITPNRCLPGGVCGPRKFVSFAQACTTHGGGLTADGQAWMWGLGRFGQLGNGQFMTARTPVRVGGGHTWTALSCGNNHTVGITTAGLAYAWGYNGSGCLGGGAPTNSCRSSPLRVCSADTFTAIGAGLDYSVGVRNDGRAFSWGYNAYGQLGINSSVICKTAPVQVCGNLSFTFISVGTYHVLGITGDGLAYGWGFGGVGAVGNNSQVNKVFGPTRVCDGGRKFTYVSAQRLHSAGVTKEGEGYAWGYNLNGQIGDGTLVNRLTPVLICGGQVWTKINAGESHTVGLTKFGKVWAWGLGSSGQLGNGSTVSQLTPVQVCL